MREPPLLSVQGLRCGYGGKLMLLDEPSEGIQPSIVLVERNIDMIRAMAQRYYVMDKGRMVAKLTPEMLDDRDTVRRYLAV